MVMRSCICGLFMAMTFSISAAVPSTDQGAVDERVRTLQVYNSLAPLVTGTPVISPGAPGSVVVEFDMLEDDRRFLRYELIHCNADWQPSVLTPVEYLDGFNEGYIEDYAFSDATTVPYVHYRLELPQGRMQPLVSGNYLVRIYDEADPEDTLLRARYMQAEKSAPIAVNVHSRADFDTRNENQQLELAVDIDGLGHSVNPFQDLKVVITQNGRTDNEAVLTVPSRVVGGNAIYEHRPELVFPGGNEYRRFEIISTQWPGMRVENIEWHAPYYNYYIETDQGRSGKDYLYDQTLSGGYLVREFNADHPSTGADYGVVHLALEHPELIGMDVFVDSDALGREFSPATRMVYNRATGCYEKAVLLKQGAYSYQYLAVPSGKDTGLTSVLEGNHNATVNLYSISVYLRQPGQRYDRLLESVNIYSR